MNERPTLRQTYTTLATWSDNYEPSTKLDKTMKQLVDCVIDPDMTHDLSKKEITHLRKMNALAEYQIEKKAALDMIAAPNSLKVLNNFVYTDYQKLIDSEKALIDAHTKDNKSKPWLFIGGGPLPLSAILLAKEHAVNSQVLDTSDEAVEISSNLVAKLEKENILQKDAIKISKADATTFEEYNNHKVIFVAALAGETQTEKQTIFRQIKQYAPEDAHVLARSSHGNRKLLYLPVPETAYEDFDLIYEMHPRNEVINSAILFRKPKQIS